MTERCRLWRTGLGLAAYQPANRYWTFQWYETSVFVVAALALAGLCFWLIRRCLT